MKRSIWFKSLLIGCVLTLIGAIPGQCRELSREEKTLLYNAPTWYTSPINAQYCYLLSYLPQINEAMGLQPYEFTAEDIRIMSKDDPDYQIAIAYTDYTEQKVYLNMESLNMKAAINRIGGIAAIETLAHEVRHLYQEKYQTIPYEPIDVNNMATYLTNKREMDANTFAAYFIGQLDS